MIEVIVCVIRVVEPLADVPPDPEPDLDVPVEAPPPGRLPPPRAGAVVSGVGTVVVVVGAGHGTVVVVEGGVAATVVVDCCGVEVVDVVEVVDDDVDDVVEVEVDEVLVVDESGAVVVVAVSTGTVSGVVGVVGVVGVGDAGGAGGVIVGHPIRAALAVEGTDDAVVPVDREGVLGVLACTTLELVWPSMRWRTVRVDDSCTAPSTLSVVVRSPCLTVAVLKIDGGAPAAFVAGLRVIRAAAAPPASARQTTAPITTRRLR